jgi:catechol 2,3-dioxygenase-like lactoylglutathione lyase family enzyme
LIAVRDVEASSRWYQRLLGCRSAHGGPEYERLVSGDALVLQLHAWESDHEHGPIGDPRAAHGNGVLLWFEIDDLDGAMARVAELGAEIVLPRHRNPPSGDGGPNHWECWLRDPDGYTVVLASPDGSAGPAPRSERPD